MGSKGVWTADNLRCWSSRRSMRADRIRTAALEASRQLLNEVGPRAFTVKEAARRAGVGRTTVYKFFGHKAGLLAACREAVSRKSSRNLAWSPILLRARFEGDRRQGSELSPTLAMVREAILAMAQHLQAETDLFLLATAEGIRSCRRPYCRGAEDPPAPVPSRFFRAVAELLKDAQQAGEIQSSLDPRAVAGWLSALWWQELCLRGPRPDGAPSERTQLASSLSSFLGALRTA